jgi:AAA15 family ATPase/GTPase
MDITKFGLQNFRVFKEHFEFELAPIMVLTGPNSSGKSSMTKALLILQASENELNESIHWDFNLNYFKGDHDLGNHKMTVNTIGENSWFSLTFFEDYKLIIAVDNQGKILWDYLIADKNDNLIIAQLGGYVSINVIEFANYLISRLQYLENLEIEIDNLENLEIEIDKPKIKEFIVKLIELYSEFQLIDLDVIFDYDFQVNFKNSFLMDEDRINSFKEDMKNGILRMLKYDEIDKENQPNDDSDWQGILCFLFRKITSIQLTEKEIQYLIPSSANINHFEKKVLQIADIYYINSFKEPFKRTYSRNESSFFRFFIQSEICKNDGGISSKPTEFKINTNEETLEKKGIEYPKLSILNTDINSFINSWIQKLEIGNELQFGYNHEHDFFYFKIDNQSLTEIGQGIGLIVRLLLEILNKSFNVRNIYRDSIEDELFTIHFPCTFIIEEPETGLHPSLQSKIAEMLVDFQKKFKVNIIVETHSEYFIRKLQYLTATNEIKSGDAIIYYFNNPKKIPEGEEQIKKITIEKDGSLTDNFGPGFIDEGTSLKFELMRLNKSRQN